MIKVEVKDSAVVERSLTSRAGKPLTFREQSAYAFTLDQTGQPRPYPQQIKLNLREGQQPYAVGNYSLSPASVWVDRYGSLALAPKLTPLK